MLNKLLRISILIIISLVLYSCPPTSPELPGDITGIVTDAETSEPIYQAKVGLAATDDTTNTGNDGIYWLKKN